LKNKGLDKEKYHRILIEYIPENAIDGVITLLEIHPVYFEISRERTTKLGDFRVLRTGQLKITVNHNLNKYNFLLTLIHELAHLITHKKFKRVKPHGIEWKNEFQTLMLPFLNNLVFPNDLLPYLAHYLKNPKAATGSDAKLAIALKKYDAPNDKTYLFQLEKGTHFQLQNKSFILGNKRRTRYECVEVGTKRKYVVHMNAEVEVVRS
jgi:hypothetical protein